MSDVPLASHASRPPGFRSGERVFLYLVIASCALVSGLALVGPLASLTAHRSIDYGEGWNAYWAAAAMGAGPLYAKSHVLVANNYPPLSFYVSGLLGKMTGDNIVAGRIVATGSMLCVAALIAMIVRRCGASRAWATAAALLFLTYAILYFSQFVGVNNPQWLGQAVMLAGVLPLLSADGSPPTPRRILCATGIMVLAGLVKHNQIALPLSATLWLARVESRALRTWIAAGIGWALVACLLLFALFGPAIFIELLAFKRTTDTGNFYEGLRKIGCFAALAAVALVSAPGRWRDRRWLFFALYALFGLLFGALQRLGSGVYVNAHFDALIALSILSGIVLGTPVASPGRMQAPAARALLLIALLLPLALVAKSHVVRSLREFRDRRETAAAWNGMIGDVRAATGPVLCEVPAVCYWAGKPFSLDFFAYGQKLRTGTSPLPLANFIDHRRAALLILDPDYDRQSGQGRLPAPFPALMRARYSVVRSVPGSIEERAPDAR
jgi:hypothetical protein